VKIKVVDWQDREFRVALNAGLSVAVRDGLDVDCATVAERVQAELRAEGYPDARIAYSRSVADVWARVAHWTVWRDGSRPSDPGRATALPTGLYPGCPGGRQDPLRSQAERGIL
jgi:hypothetical protein